MECISDNNTNSVTNTGFSYDPATDISEFEYTIVFVPSAAGPLHAVIGADVSDLEVVDCFPKCFTGFEFNSYVGGVVFELNLNFMELDQQTFMQNNRFEHCKLGAIIRTAKAISLSPWPTTSLSSTTLVSTLSSTGPRGTSSRLLGATSLGGHVYIAGTSDSPANELTRQIPIVGAEVLLVDNSLPGAQEQWLVLAHTQTDSEGHYAFTNLDPNVAYAVALSDHGGVLDVTRSSVVINTRNSSDTLAFSAGYHLTDRDLSINANYPFGVPLAVTLGSDTNTFPVLFWTDRFNDQTNYQVEGANYRGNPKGIGFWTYQYHALDEGCGRLSLPDYLLTAAATDAAGFIPSCLPTGNCCRSKDAA